MQPAYGLVDAWISWLSGNAKWRFGVSGKNLTDEEYLTNGYNLPVAWDPSGIVRYAAHLRRDPGVPVLLMLSPGGAARRPLVFSFPAGQPRCRSGRDRCPEFGRNHDRNRTQRQGCHRHRRGGRHRASDGGALRRRGLQGGGVGRQRGAGERGCLSEGERRRRRRGRGRDRRGRGSLGLHLCAGQQRRHRARRAARQVQERRGCLAA